MEQEKIQHLEFIQNIINRMNKNSFQIKGWMITIVSALLALYASSNNYFYVFVAIAPTLIFWFIDSYYLQQEKRFRGLYEDVIDPKKNIPAFSKLDAYATGIFSMDISDYKLGRYKYCSSLFSLTTATLYLTVACCLLMGGLIIVKMM